MSRVVAVLVFCLCVGFTLAAENVGGTHTDWLRHRDALSKNGALLRHYTFEDLRGPDTPVVNRTRGGGDLTFRAAPVAGKEATPMRVAEGRWPEKTAAYIDAGYYAAPAPPVSNRPFSAVLWYRKHGQGVHRGNDGAENGMLIAVGNGYWEGWRLTTSSSGAVGFEIGRPQPSSSVGTLTGPIPNGTWQHLAATWDGKHMRLYVNGQQVAEREYAGVYTVPPGNNELRIGYANAGVGSAAFDVDEVAIYSRALSPREILDSYLFYAQLTDEQLDLWTSGDLAAIEKLLASKLHPDAASIARLRRLELQMREGLLEPAAAAAQLAELVNTDGIPTRVRQSARALLLSQMTAGIAPDVTLYPRYLEDKSLSTEERYSLELGYGHALAAKGDLAAASARYQQLDHDDVPAPWRGIALLSLARAQTKLGDFAAAERTYERLKSLPGEPRYRAVEVQERLRELARLKAGQPAQDPTDSRTRVPERAGLAVVLHVKPDGDDANPGTADRPVKTLARARDVIRRLDGALGAAEVVIGAGRYPVNETFTLAKEDSGTAESPVVYRAEPGVIFDAGAEVRGFEPVRDDAVLARLPREAHGKVYQADLRAQGITDLGQFVLGGFASARGFKTHPVMQLYFNGKAMQIARWPNSGYVHLDKVVQPGVFTMQEDRISRWAGEKDAWLHGYWYFDWADSYEKIASIDAPAKQITLAPPFTRYGEGGFRAGQRFYALNLLSELDAPGEWYLDRESGMLYFYPPSDPSAASVQVSILEKPVLEMTDVSHVRIEGITWQNGRGDGVIIRGGEGVLLAGCTLRQFTGNAVEIHGGVGHGLLGCDLHELGRGGAIITGGDRKTLTPGGHFMENCHVHHFSRIDHTYTPAVLLSGVGNRIAHCRMHDARSSAMRIEGNEHLIEYNRVHHVLLESDDQGGADLWGNPTFRGNVFRYNWWHDMDKSQEVGGAGIRLDDVISGTVIYGNIFQRAAAGRFGGVQIHGGKENLIENNLFIDCTGAISGGSFPLERWRRFLSTTEGKQRYEEVSPAQPPYSQRYPELQEIEENLTNFLWRNVVVNCGTFLLHPAKVEHAHNWITGGNPGLDEHMGVRSGSALAARMSFVPIPAERIGLYTDRHRKALPER